MEAVPIISSHVSASSVQPSWLQQQARALNPSRKGESQTHICVARLHAQQCARKRGRRPPCCGGYAAAAAHARFACSGKHIYVCVCCVLVQVLHIGLQVPTDLAC